MASPCIGHLDPYFLAAMDETQRLLRYLFQTEHPFTIPVSGTGSAGMETCFVNLIEPGRRSGGVRQRRVRHADVGHRRPDRREADLASTPRGAGRSIREAVRKAVRGRNPKVLAVVHAETSTGVRQPLEDLGEIARQAGALFLVDTVTSLGGIEVAVDRLGHRRGLQRHAEMPVLPAGAGPHLVQSRRAGGPEEPQDAGGELVSRHGHGGQLLGRASGSTTTRPRST